MRVLQVCAEIFPLLKTGGLADVAGALPPALAAQGVDVRVLLPGFPAILAGLAEPVEVCVLQPPEALAGGGARLLFGHLPRCGGVPAFVIDAPGFYDRPGGPYDDAVQRPYDDNALRFALLGWTAARLGEGLDPYWRPDVVHAHDWHAALAPAYLRAAREAGAWPLPASVLTVHNLAYQGSFDPWQFGQLGLPGHYYSIHGVECHGQLNFLKAGLYFADRLTTVSPGYAREIQSPEQGCGLDGLLRDRADVLGGILNGVDDAVWNPAHDPALLARYAPGRMVGKARCKTALREELRLAANGAPLFCIVSRLTEQKGLHLVLQALPAMLELGAQLALIGSGDAGLENAFRQAATNYPDQVAVRIGYDETFAHRLIAGSDVIMVPSLFEPCGLTQLYGLKYGTLPLVRRVGGLADTVADTRLETLDTDATGFVFDAFDAAALLHAVHRALALHRRPAEWKTVQRRGMEQPLGWDTAAARYLALYRQLA